MASIDTHYSAEDIEARILDALREAGLNPDERLSPLELGALDHFHTGGFPASLILQELAQIQAEDRILDIGAGLAGPARMLAASPGCRVDCIELTPDYCAGAELLNKLTGLEDLIGVYEGSALDMPFDDNSFEVAWMQNVGMNIKDKRGLYTEVCRVLKPNGRFAFQEMAAGETDTSYFPLPWATDPADNLLVSIDEMHSMLNESGFVAEYYEDVSDTQLNPPKSGTPTSTANSTAQAQLSLSTYVDDLALKAENATRSLQEGQIRFVRGVFRVK
jgi:SAM-dependent methyltransferase